MSTWFAQAGHGVRFDWGAAGAQRLAPGSACLVVVDVLSFTTSVSVAAEAGSRVYPYPWRDATAAAFARRHGAVLAVGRRESNAVAPWSLSPAALRRAPFTPALVLPSPNGSAIAASAKGLVVVAACLRNAGAAGRWLAGGGYGGAGQPVLVIAAGEHWPDGSLRPAVEDLLGAGAVIAALAAAGAGPLSPEAEAARASWEAIAGVPTELASVPAALASCASGRELAETGFAEDVAIASEVDVSPTVPVLTDGAFTDLPGPRPPPVVSS